MPPASAATPNQMPLASTATGLVVTQPLSLSAATVAPGGTITASFTVQNQGTASLSLAGLDIAARGPDGSNQDFGGLWNVSIAPGQSVTVQKSRTFTSSDKLGTWTIFASYQTTDAVWHSQAPQLSFNVTATPPTNTPVPPTPTPIPSGAGLAVSGPLQISANSVTPGGSITASFTLQNQGSAPLSLAGLVIAARTPAGANADFGGLWNVSLAPGQRVTLQKSRAFTSADPAGTWAIFGSYQTTDAVWHPLAPQLSFTVAASSVATATGVPSTNTPVPPKNTPVLPTSTPQPPAPAPGGAIALGAYIHDNGKYVDSGGSLIDWYAGLVGRMPAMVNVGTDMVHYANFSDQVGILDAIRTRGAMPIYTMMTEDYTQGANQPAYSDRTIANGAYDSYFRAWAAAAKSWGHTVYLRFDHEMNGNWYAWGTQSGNANGNSPADYAAMWRHVHDIFTSAGATNVKWIWCANVDYSGATPYSQDYPGDSYVDWVSMDGYNWGGTPGHAWQSLYSIFAQSYAEITSLTSKPLMISETASEEAGGSKASWITTSFLTTIPQSFPRIKGVLWFDSIDGTHDWRVNSSYTSLSAFQQVAASPTYHGTLP
jgi:beta-mannanase